MEIYNLKNCSVFSVRFFIAIIFILSGLSKLLSIVEFRNTLVIIKLSESLLTVVVYGLPLFEIIIGFMFLIGLYIKISGKAIFLLLMMFNVVIMIQIIKGLDIDCNCFGNILKSKMDIYGIIRNFILSFLVLGVTFYKDGNHLFSIDSLRKIWAEK